MSAAPNKTAITARITRCRHGAPLIELSDQPFNGLEIRPAELEQLARNLLAVAALARQHSGKRDATVVLS